MKRFSKYFQVVINTVAESTEFRFNHVLSFLVISLPLIFTVLLWKKVFGDTGQIGLFDLKNMVTYYFLVVLLQDITYPGPFWEIIDHIREGGLNVFLSKPIGYPGYIFALKIGINIPYLFMSGVILILLGIMAGFNKYLILPPNPLSFACFILSFSLAVCSGFMFSFIFSALTFWLEEGRGIEVFLEFLIGLSSGMLLPVSLYPRGLKAFCSILPFRYVLNFPIEIYLGVVKGRELIEGLANQVMWCILAFLILRIVWKSGLKKYEAVGA
ncbi:MAG: ABC-2 family transporter protein [bacterium]|nr:ABC-2 family transporter protein [bacterium]